MTMFRRLSAFFAIVTATLGTAAVGQSLTLTNLKGPVARACGVAEAKSIAQLWQQLDDCARPHVHPTPVPSPSPTFTPTPAIAPTLSGLDKIGSGLTVGDHLTPAWGSGGVAASSAPDVVGAFRFICAPSHNAYDDPIVFPGQPGKSHLHTFFGNTLADGNSTYETLRRTGDSTCNNMLNRSAYWIAAMMNGRGQVVMPDYVAIYYKRLPASSPMCKVIGRACVGLPRGLRYIFGHNMADPASTPINVYRQWWNCDGAGAIGGHFANIAQAAKGCPVGARLGQVLVAPECWNGRELDSPDHRSHVVYADDYSWGDGVGRCPTTHPFVLPQFTLGAWYTTDATLDRSGDESVGAKTWHLSSDRMPGMAPAVPGTTQHTDWFGAWEDEVMDLWTANCIDRMLNCSGGDLGNGRQMTMQHGYTYRAEPRLVPVPPQIAQ